MECSIFVLMAEYNRLMNQKVISNVSPLSLEALNSDRGAFFGSIIGTLNHILVGDTIWFKRFSEHEAAFLSLDYVRKLPKPKSLADILYTELDAFIDARTQMDQMIQCFADELTTEHIRTTFSYSNVKGVKASKNFGLLIQHVFNHQTHHRGQLTTLLSQVGIDVGETDLLMCIPNIK